MLIDDEGGWEFIDAFSDSKLPQNGKDNKGHSEKPCLQDGSHGSTDLFGAPNNGVFVESHEEDKGIKSKPITNIQNGFTLDIKVDSKGTTNELNSNPPGGSIDLDDGFGGFETAFMEHPSKKKENNNIRPWQSLSYIASCFYDVVMGETKPFCLPPLLPE